MPRLTTVRTKPSVCSQVASVRTPSHPGTIKVVIAPDGLRPRATNSTPDELRTGPGVTASTLIDGGWPAKRAAISNTEIGPAASSNWKSGNTSTPIMIFGPCPETREICHFGQETIMTGWPRQVSGRPLHVRSSCPDLIRASILLRKSLAGKDFAQWMDCRVKPGNDGWGLPPVHRINLERLCPCPRRFKLVSSCFQG